MGNLLPSPTLHSEPGQDGNLAARSCMFGLLQHQDLSKHPVGLLSVLQCNQVVETFVEFATKIPNLFPACKSSVHVDDILGNTTVECG